MSSFCRQTREKPRARRGVEYRPRCAEEYCGNATKKTRFAQICPRKRKTIRIRFRDFAISLATKGENLILVIERFITAARAELARAYLALKCIV